MDLQNLKTKGLDASSLTSPKAPSTQWTMLDERGNLIWIDPNLNKLSLNQTASFATKGYRVVLPKIVYKSVEKSQEKPRENYVVNKKSNRDVYKYRKLPPHYYKSSLSEDSNSTNEIVERKSIKLNKRFKTCEKYSGQSVKNESSKTSSNVRKAIDNGSTNLRTDQMGNGDSQTGIGKGETQQTEIANNTNANHQTVKYTGNTLRVEHGTNPEVKKKYEPKPSNVRIRNLADNEMVFTDYLNKKAKEEVSCGTRCTGSLMSTLKSDPKPRSKEDIFSHAVDFMEQYYTSRKSKDSLEHKNRLKEVHSLIGKTGTYDLTREELLFGVKLAWRNAPRCIGRIQWSNLELFDARNAETADDMFAAICRHIKWATNKGNIRSAITIFRQRIGDTSNDFRVFNQQLISYAGYRQPNGSIIGDPAQVEFTSFCQSLGWKGNNGRFDVLPLVLQANGQEPKLFEIPKDLVLEINIVHPKLPSFAELGLKWYGLPAVSGMMLDCGGLQFTGCPFSGWYMSTEIACRDLCDEQRYNLIESIADKLGLDKSSNSSLWRDQALVEINVAVLHSYQLCGVTIVDHHTASQSFMTFLSNEHKQRGGCPADWVWIVPPISGSLCPVFHQEMTLYKLKPCYEYQDEVWRSYALKKERERKGRNTKISVRVVASAAFFAAALMAKANRSRTKCTILFATETGNSEKFANTLFKVFRQSFRARVINMENYNLSELADEELILFIVSTFGNGHPPENGKNFANGLTSNGFTISPRKKLVQNITGKALSDIQFSVFGLGSRAYPHFCAFAHFIDRNMHNLGAKRIYGVGEGDELSGQELAFRNWAKHVHNVACNNYGLQDKQGTQNAVDLLDSSDLSWDPSKFRTVPASIPNRISVAEELTRLHRKNVTVCQLKDRVRFEMSAGRLTILAKIDIESASSAMQYSPGDHVLLFPNNPAQLVQNLMHSVKDVADRNQPVKVEQRFTTDIVDKNDNTDTWQDYIRFPPSLLKDIFTTYVDISTPPTQDLLQELSDMATSRTDRSKLSHLATNTNAYDKWKSGKMSNIVDVLRDFPSIKVTSSFLMVRLPLLQPRYYSISSSPEASPGEIHVTADVVQYQTPDGIKHKGLCSNWINEVPIGRSILCAVKSAPLFHLPQDKMSPVIMVGPGTGIAPFRSFWMHRREEMKKNPGKYGPMYLYFGCRNSTTDNFYKNELLKCEDEGVITRCYFAYSRENGLKKTYVQDLLKQNGKEIYQQIVTQNGHFYICGNIQMASDIKNMLQFVIQKHSNMTEAQSESYIEKMITEDRLHEDIFGLANK